MQVNCILSIFALYTSFWYVYKFEIVYAEIFLFNYLFFSNYQFAFKLSIFRNSNSRKEMISLCNLSLRSSNTCHQMRTVKKCAVFGNLRKNNYIVASYSIQHCVILFPMFLSFVCFIIVASYLLLFILQEFSLKELNSLGQFLVQL